MSIFRRRCKLVKAGLAGERLDAILISQAVNIDYLTGFTGTFAYLVITRKDVFLVTDSRYYHRAVNEINGVKVRLAGEDVYRQINQIVLSSRIKRLGFEADSVTYQRWREWKKNIHRAVLVPVRQVVETLRIEKTKEEIAAIKLAVRVADRIMADIKRYCYPGITEEDLGGKITKRIRDYYQAEPSFPPIVAFGRNTANPHARSGKKILGNNQLVMIDLGVMLGGYSSDLTRTFWLGRITTKFNQIYNIVLEAQKKAIEKIAPGVTIGEIDSAARDYMRIFGLARYFRHSLGHGVGKEVHELPKVYRTNKDVLRPGMVFSVEPGIYFPGWGGVRIEDLVLVNERGGNVLSNSPKGLEDIIIS